MESVVRIEGLLDKYFEAETSLAEEQELATYFTGDAVDPSLIQYQPIFQHHVATRAEIFRGTMPGGKKSSIISWIAVAAVAGLGFGFFFGQDYREQQKAEYAYQETRKAMTLLAENLDRGTNKVALLKEFQNTTNKIYNNPN